MDEVDGMSSGDRGGVAELIQVVSSLSTFPHAQRADTAYRMWDTAYPTRSPRTPRLQADHQELARAHYLHCQRRLQPKDQESQKLLLGAQVFQAYAHHGGQAPQDDCRGI
jgi:hypothetical protein